MASAGIPPIVTVQTALNQLVDKSVGLTSISISDADGIVLLNSPEAPGGEENKTQERDMIQTMVFSIGSEQATKISLGKAKFVTAKYNDCIMIQANDEPVIIRLVAAKDANMGAMIELLPQIAELLGPLREVVKRETVPDQ
eukprot:TRINITY_DN39540_c0_g1_i1.p3 TRINITY_DN39540_c0_g1~~TRINITY_DN39540_c0_g1_i1.p3  ORF type:complete len:141 (-),score=36.33 TRINITY_DN39540_c0_g1_i1:178-600(-)